MPTVTTKIDTSFTICDEHTVKKLLKESPELLPNYPEEKAVNRGIDLAYGKEQISASVTSGILQGKSIPGIANDLQNRIETMNRNSAIRVARTACTEAENAGRLDSYLEAQQMGIDLQKQWMATSDNRTRPDHAKADGQTVDIDQPFEVGSDKLMFPGDPTGSPGEIYNCRCTMVSLLKDLEEPEEAEDTVSSEEAQYIKDSAKVDHIGYNKVKDLDHKLTDSEIVSKISGGDETGGSCVSLALTYVANEYGLDVEDFRGGNSRSLFAHQGTIEQIGKLAGDGYTRVDTMAHPVKESAQAIIDNVKDKDKIYFFGGGKHAAALRRTDAGIEYCELQSPDSEENGWKPLNRNVLNQRFCINKGQATVYGNKVPTTIRIIDGEALASNPEFRTIMGYINTSGSAQKKGSSGSVK